MVARKILKWPDARLLKHASSIEVFDESIQQLAKDLFDTMKVNFGAGLAATQIDDDRAAMVLDTQYVPSLPGDPLFDECVFLANPIICPVTDRDFSWREGCLSVDDVTAYVKRHGTIKLKYQNSLGETIESELSATESAAVQHEADHLIGKLFIHRLEGVTRHLTFNRLKKISNKKRAQIKAEKKRSVNRRKKKRAKKRK